jgi:hypothetical protein
MKPILKNSILDIGEPPLSVNDNGEARRVGIEIEFGGLYLRDAVDLVIDTLGGTAKIQRHNAWQVVDTNIGDLIVEIDADILQGKKSAGTKPDPEDSIAKLLDDAEKHAYRVAGEVSSSLVPVEIVTPPLQFEELDQLESVISALRDAGAEGTAASFLNGFGLHLNPEAASLNPDYITRCLRAFFLLEDILWDDADVDTTRALMPFISKFPEAYKQKVINPKYQPTIDQLIDDYLAANPTRNRDLDMLPLFAHIDQERVMSQIKDQLVKARPTFHYRLPNCRLEDPNWDIGEEWRRWICVEVLADDDELLHELSEAYLDHAKCGHLKAWTAYLKEHIHE